MGAVKELLLSTQFHNENSGEYIEILTAVNILRYDGVQVFEVFNPAGLEFRINVSKDIQIKMAQTTDSVGGSEGLIELQYGGMTVQESNRYGNKIGKLTYQEALKRIKFCIDNKTAYFERDPGVLLEEFKEKMNRMRKPFRPGHTDLSIEIDLDNGELIQMTEAKNFLHIRKEGVLIKSSNRPGEVFNFIHQLNKHNK